MRGIGFWCFSFHVPNLADVTSYAHGRASCCLLFSGQVTSTGRTPPNTDGMEETVVDLCKMLLSYSAVCFQRSWGLNDRFKQLAPSFRKRLLKAFSSTGQGDVATDISSISSSSVAMASVAITGRRGELAFLDCMKEESEDYECVKKRVSVLFRYSHTGNAVTQVSQAISKDSVTLRGRGQTKSTSNVRTLHLLYD